MKNIRFNSQLPLVEGGFTLLYFSGMLLRDVLIQKYDLALVVRTTSYATYYLGSYLGFII